MRNELFYQKSSESHFLRKLDFSSFTVDDVQSQEETQDYKPIVQPDSQLKYLATVLSINFEKFKGWGKWEDVSSNLSSISSEFHFSFGENVADSQRRNPSSFVTWEIPDSDIFQSLKTSEDRENISTIWSHHKFIFRRRCVTLGLNAFPAPWFLRGFPHPNSTYRFARNPAINEFCYTA